MQRICHHIDDAIATLQDYPFEVFWKQFFGTQYDKMLTAVSKRMTNKYRESEWFLYIIPIKEPFSLVRIERILMVYTNLMFQCLTFQEVKDKDTGAVRRFIASFDKTKELPEYPDVRMLPDAKAKLIELIAEKAGEKENMLLVERILEELYLATYEDNNGKWDTSVHTPSFIRPRSEEINRQWVTRPELARYKSVDDYLNSIAEGIGEGISDIKAIIPFAVGGVVLLASLVGLSYVKG
jgi:hypothetical protein